jgi:hypothetical protein
MEQISQERRTFLLGRHRRIDGGLCHLLGGRNSGGSRNGKYESKQKSTFAHVILQNRLHPGFTPESSHHAQNGSFANTAPPLINSRMHAKKWINTCALAAGFVPSLNRLTAP